LPIVGGGELGHRSIFLQASHREEVQMSSMKKEEARRAVLSEYDRWAKKHPNKAGADPKRQVAGSGYFIVIRTG
jgi:hypothetical protein